MAAKVSNLGGLGIVSPVAGFVGPFGALLLGIVAGTACFFAIGGIKRGLRIDDALDVFPVHGVGGMIGALLLPVLSLSILGGTGLPGEHSLSEQIGIQAIAVLVSAGWSVVISFGLLKLIDALTGLRVSADEETEGLDLSSHNGKGYHF